MKRFFFFAPVVLFMFSCKPVTGDDLSGNLEIIGTVYLNDTLNVVMDKLVLRNQLVQVKNLSDSNSQNFLYSAKTDALGHFRFTNLRNQEYYIVAEKDTFNLLFTAKTKLVPQVNGPDHGITLYPDSMRFNAVTIIARDELTGSLLNNARICFFINKQKADSNQCEGNFFSDATNRFGRLTTTKLPAGRIYINAQDSVGKVNLRGKDFVDTRPIGFSRKEIFLK